MIMSNWKKYRTIRKELMSLIHKLVLSDTILPMQTHLCLTKPTKVHLIIKLCMLYRKQ